MARMATSAKIWIETDNDVEYLVELSNLENDAPEIEIEAYFLPPITFEGTFEIERQLNAHDLAEIHLGVYEAERILRND